jgi:hypothetical protein
MMDSIVAASNPDEETIQPTFACNLLALTPAKRQRHAAVTRQLGQMVHAIAELPDGYGFQLAPKSETLQLLAEFVASERLCCPFFTFSIRVEANDGPLWLHLTGPEGIKPFIQAELDW